MSFGRLKVIKRLVSNESFTLNIGSGLTKFGNINLDINPLCSPDIVGDARDLPFRSEIIEQAILADIIEHLPRGDDTIALKEVFRVLKDQGKLVISVPNDLPIFTFLDPSLYTFKHRHYKFKNLVKLLNNGGFEVLSSFTSGGLWTCLSWLCYCLLVYPLKRILRVRSSLPSLLVHLADNEYRDVRARARGYTLFVLSRKVSH